MPSVKIIRNEPRIINIKNKEIKMKDHMLGEEAKIEPGTYTLADGETEVQVPRENTVQILERNQYGFTVIIKQAAVPAKCIPINMVTPGTIIPIDDDNIVNDEHQNSIDEIEEMIQTIAINGKHEIAMNGWECEVLTRMLTDYKQKSQTIKQLRYRIADLNKRIKGLEEEVMDYEIELSTAPEPRG